MLLHISWSIFHLFDWQWPTAVPYLLQLRSQRIGTLIKKSGNFIFKIINPAIAVVCFPRYGLQDAAVYCGCIPGTMRACSMLVEVEATKRSSRRNTFPRVRISLSWWNTPCRRSAVGTCVWPLRCPREKTSMNGLQSTVSVTYLLISLQWF